MSGSKHWDPNATFQPASDEQAIALQKVRHNKCDYCSHPYCAHHIRGGQAPEGCMHCGCDAVVNPETCAMELPQ